MQELIPNCHEYYDVDTLVIIIVRATNGWLLHVDVLAVHMPQTVMVVSSAAELGRNFLPLVFSFREADHFVIVDIYDDLRTSGTQP